MDSISDFTLIKDLDDSKDTFKMKVKVLRLWTLPDLKNIGEVFSMEMILMDEQGTKIQANVLRKWIAKFKSLLQEGVDLIIVNPTIGENRSKFRYGINPKKISFYYDTKLYKCMDFTGSDKVFSFADFDDIYSNTLPEKLSIDIIGDVVTYTAMDTKINQNGKENKKMTMQLQNLEGRKLNVTLWNRFAEQLSDFVQSHTDQRRVIVILQFALLTYWQDRASVSNNYDVSKFYINADIDEINQFRDKLLESNGKNTHSEHMTFVSSMAYSYEDDFLAKTELGTLTDLMGCFELKSFIVVATIVGIQKRYQWHYLGCNTCHCRAHKTDESKESYYCNSTKCKGKVICVVPRYKIPLRVQDADATVTLTLFDHDAIKILGISAKDLYEKYNQIGDVDVVPKEFDVFIEKKYAFKVDVKKFNLDTQSTVYSISKLTNDENIVSKLVKKLSSQQATETDSLNMNLSDFESQDGKVYKDAASYTGENATPNIVEKSTAESPSTVEKNKGKNISQETNLKRSLDCLYDLDDTSKSSSSKNPRNSGVCSNTIPLLVPKIEK